MAPGPLSPAPSGSCVKYATGPSIHGPWTERGVLVERNPAVGIVGTGHHGVIHIPGTDEWILAYHLFDAEYGSGYRRRSQVNNRY